MANHNISRKCLGDITNQGSGASIFTQDPLASLQSMTQLEQKISELNNRLDALSMKFDSLISNVQEQNREVSRLLNSSSIGVDCSSSTQTPPSFGDKSMQEQVKRSILGDDSYSIYRKTTKLRNQ